jgi:UV radiation resistance-associated gene protein
VKTRIRLRKAGIRQRREALLQAVQCLNQQMEDAVEVEAVLREEWQVVLVSSGTLRSSYVWFTSNHLASLRSRLSPTRTTLLTTLFGIFPIDLLSPPALLYTILSVPLPIPLSTTDPAPPLSLASHKEVTEDGVATALGYVAQVVNLMAIYLGKVLLYPVTCVGSRSLIKDGISAMVGPRMLVFHF